MYILESIQEFGGKKVGVYSFGAQTTKKIRRGEREFIQKGMPDFALFILSPKITKGDHDLYENISSPVQKVDHLDGVKKIGKISI